MSLHDFIPKSPGNRLCLSIFQRQMSKRLIFVSEAEATIRISCPGTADLIFCPESPQLQKNKRLVSQLTVRFTAQQAIISISQIENQRMFREPNIGR
jgi:hypothetical protein